MTRHPLLLMLSLLTLVSCNNTTIDFSYSPSQPRAGEKVSFVNASSEGEEWLWHFGDREVSALKNPYHTYKKPGTYQVELQVDGKEKWTCTHFITVVDTTPSFVSDHDTITIGIYEDVTFTPLVYNPNKETENHQWTLTPTHYAVTDSSASAFKIYFTQPGEVKVQLTVTLKGQTTVVEHIYTVEDRQAPALLMMGADSACYRQRFFFASMRKEEVLPLTNAEAISLLHNNQDTVQQVEDSLFRLPDLQKIFPQMIGFKISNRRVYYRTAQGLFVAFLNGSDNVAITQQPVLALSTDTQTPKQGIYWTTTEGTFYMPFVQTTNNRFDKSNIELINKQPNVVSLVLDPTPRLRD